ncbi:hypothetical protein CHS0354_009854 [Potamilus streckersoni]|uniref:Uncharacterized protein n=1 Tax=Potamilus streckersoni TaxID=2493646 RepID=A0AAE0W350_9BIVA|nr:hypothetical protein CHS0354_009854 [Potamilus streckersoni]
MVSIGLSLFVVLAFLSSSLADKTFNSSGVFVKVLGQSGKISIGQRENQTGDPNLVMVEFSEIKEKSSDGTAVGETGKQKHSFNTFANQNFNFSEVVKGSYQNLSAIHFSFTADLTSVNSQLVTVIYIFTEAGNITVDNETTEVESGTVKFNIEMKNWSFCGTNNINCSKGNADETGALIDFDIIVKGKGNATKVNETTERMKGTRGDNYDLGGGAKIIMSKKVKYDNGPWSDMAVGYPKVSSTGDKQTFTFRFLKFNQSVLYDPTIQLAQGNTNTSVDNGTSNVQENTLGEGNVYVNILGKSGKITIGSKIKPADDPDRVTIELDGLQEIANDSKNIHDSDHVFQTFANQDFTFMSVINTTFQNISASIFRFNATVGSQNALVMLSVYIFRGNGSLSINGENTTVRAGTVKFNTEISGWKFCNGTMCTHSQIGEYLDLYITVKGKGEKPEKLVKKKFSNGDEYSLGGSSYLVMSKKVRSDGNWTDMPTGYPLIISRGNKKTFVIRMPKFSSNSFYDPNVEINIPDDGTSGAIIHVSSLIFNFFIAIVTLSGIFG